MKLQIFENIYLTNEFIKTKTIKYNVNNSLRQACYNCENLSCNVVLVNPIP